VALQGGIHLGREWLSRTPRYESRVLRTLGNNISTPRNDSKQKPVILLPVWFGDVLLTGRAREHEDLQKRN
jgi:hypothetical protein